MTIVEISTIIVASAVVIITLFFLITAFLVWNVLRKVGQLAKKLESTVDQFNEDAKLRISRFDDYVAKIKDVKQVFTFSKRALDLFENWKSNKKQKKEDE